MEIASKCIWKGVDAVDSWLSRSESDPFVNRRDWEAQNEYENDKKKEMEQRHPFLVYSKDMMEKQKMKLDSLEEETRERGT